VLEVNLPALTVILAVKDPDQAQLNACVWSIASLRNSRNIDLLMVYSGSAPVLDNSCRVRFHEVRLVESEPLGVYCAYNRGLDERLSLYVLFMGADDLALPGLDVVLDSVRSEENSPDVIACYSYMQNVGLSGPSRVKGALIFRNWCHQGLLYGSRLFTKKRFDVRYKVQADHKFNLELFADRNLKVDYRSDVITHFASGGLTSKVPDLRFRADMPDIVRAAYGNFYWLIALGKRALADIIKGSPESRFKSGI